MVIFTVITYRQGIGLWLWVKVGLRLGLGLGLGLKLKSKLRFGRVVSLLLGDDDLEKKENIKRDEIKQGMF